MLMLQSKWADKLLRLPESGMGYQVVNAVMKDGRTIENVTIVGGVITLVSGKKEIPFSEDEIADFVSNTGLQRF